MDKRDELRPEVVRILDGRRQTILSDAASVFPFADPQQLGAADSARACSLVLRLLVETVRTGVMDAHHTAVGDLYDFTEERGIGVPQLFATSYLLERTALDELALDETYGATSEDWPAMAQLVRRSSFDGLAAFTDRVNLRQQESVRDPLTTTFTRGVLEAVLDKEVHRASRFGHGFAVILFDVDEMAVINAEHGYGFGDRVLERIGIVMQSFFREQDWVTRYGEDAFAVVLPETVAEPAADLAEKFRASIEERLALRDYRTDKRVAVTVSVAVIAADAGHAQVSAADVLRQAEQVVHRAKHNGRNRVERAEPVTPGDAAEEVHRRGLAT